MLDRITPPAPKPIENVLSKKPQIGTSSGFPTLVYGESKLPIILFELILESGKWFEDSIGISYFTSKMLSEGCQRLDGGEIAQSFETLGSHLEVASGADFVSFKLYSLRRNFEVSLALLQEVLWTPTFPEKEFNTLKQIRIHNLEYRLAKNSEYATMKFFEQLMGASNPYGHLITVPEIESIGLDNVRHYYSNYFFNKPKAMVVGDLGENEHRLIENFFASFKTVEHAERRVFPTQDPSKCFEERGGATQASIRLGKLSISRDHRDIHLLSIANMTLGGYFGSRLMKNIREDKGLTYGINSSLSHLNHASYFQISAEVEQQNIDLTLKEIQVELNRLANEFISDTEIETVKNYSKGKFLMSIDSPLAILSLFRSQFLLGQGLNYHDDFLATLEEIRPIQISEMVRKYLSEMTVEVLIK